MLVLVIFVVIFILIFCYSFIGLYNIEKLLVFRYVFRVVRVGLRFFFELGASVEVSLGIFLGYFIGKLFFSAERWWVLKFFTCDFFLVFWVFVVVFGFLLLGL